jgi:VWFA-related protein
MEASMASLRWRRSLVLSWLLLFPLAAFAEDPPPTTEPGTVSPLLTDLQEQVERRLIQLDVTVSGPSGLISTLTRDDFELYIGNIALGGQRIEELYVDSLCSVKSDLRESGQREALGAGVAPLVNSVAPKGSYVFYFDQAHLTMEGRVRSLELARELVEEVVTQGSQAMVVSSGAETRAFADLTHDHMVLLDALDRIEQDPKQLDTFAEAEWNRLAGSYDAVRFGPNFTNFVLESIQEAEVAHTVSAVHRLTMVIRRLVDLPPPKVLLYFGDTLNSRPGQVFLHPHAFTDIGPGDRYRAAEAVDAMLNDAGAAGVRIYAIQAGIPHDPMAGGARLYGLRENYSHRVDHRAPHAARHTLVALGKQTGGGCFLYGTPVAKMVRKLRKDLSCVYLLSFDPTGLPENRRLGVQLEVTRPKVKARTRRQIVVRSDLRRRHTDLTAAFASPDLSISGLPLAGRAIPIDYSNGEYATLVQLAVPPSSHAPSQWNFGISPAAGGTKNTASAGLSMDRPGVPVVFEAQLRLPPGPHALVLAAQNETSQEIGTQTLRGTWPDPDDAPITIGPVALLQPADALFLRDDAVKKRGLYICAEGQPIATDRLTALITLVCTDGSREGSPVRVKRSLTGFDATSFPVVEIDLSGDDRCIQVRDLVPAQTITEGVFTYEVRVLDDTGRSSTQEHVFHALAPRSHVRIQDPATLDQRE